MRKRRKGEPLGVGDPTMALAPFSVMGLYLSPGHNYFGHHGQAAGDHPLVSVSAVTCRAGRGIEGDRFFDHSADYRGQITFFSYEVYEELCNALGIRDKHPGVFRRNVVVAGDDLNAYVGENFEIQGVRFRGTAECSPCYWMDRAFGPGSEAMLEGRGGLRAQILSDGQLAVDSDRIDGVSGPLSAE